VATTTDSAGTSENTFVTVPGDRRSEVGRTLAEPVPQSLGLLDQFGLWGNLGVSLLGFTGAIFVLQPGGTRTPELSLAAALTAIVVGTLLGTVVLALSGIPGAHTGALWLNIADYENFLTLLGSVFVPMSAVLIADYFADYAPVPRSEAQGRYWDLSASARSRWAMLLPWAVGFVVYQLINPGYVSWWASAWSSFGHSIGFTPAGWMSASILSFAAAGAVTLLVRGMARLMRR
jgi:purine-cytosine permease-like protein